MNHHQSNKLAWEEAFDNRKEGWSERVYEKFRNEEHPFLEPVLVEELQHFDLRGKKIAQFCCNNGRELLSLCKMGAESGVGFDIAENMISFANKAAETLHMNCSFVAADILEIDSIYYETFDYIFVTVGAITWFQDLNAFFGQVSRCLKDGGCLIINEIHPFANMLAIDGEEGYDAAAQNKAVHSYFKDDPWVETDRMPYMSDRSKQYQQTFYSYSHTFASIINAMIQNGLRMIKLQEYDDDASDSFAPVSHQGIPLSYILIAVKNQLSI